jgi:hypothetical protein
MALLRFLGLLRQEDDNIEQENKEKVNKAEMEVNRRVARYSLLQYTKMGENTPSACKPYQIGIVYTK